MRFDLPAKAAMALTLVSMAALPVRSQEAPRVSPAQRSMASAQALIAKAPKAPRGYVELAMAQSRRARETSDPAYYQAAHESLDRAAAVAPDDFEMLKTRAWVLLGQHRFAEALDLANKLNARVPDDVMVYALVTDASVELGRYDEAEKATQWMLNLRPGNVPALTRTGYLRELFGDADGALEVMRMALDQTPASEVEDRAWVLTQIGHLEASRGKHDAAEEALSMALGLFPEYHYALGQMARVRAAQGRAQDALDFERRHFAASPHPENRYLLAEAFERAGQTDEARKEFAAFEKAARAEMTGPDNANRELTFYYLDHAGRSDEGLKLARAEAAIRRDVFTLDALAWALHRDGRDAEARPLIDVILKVGVEDARIAYHVGVIAFAIGDRAAARRHLETSLRLGAPSEVAAAARQALERLG